MLVITGPNMGGKSTYMRQNALIVLLAHIGSFVPASRAAIGPIDRILTRIGAGDDLARGQSTFMVEMSETSYILHHATAQSLVLMDEIGRGTSTYDGLALAEACARHLAHSNRAYTLFATHYFELTALAEPGSGIANVHLDAVEHGDALVFMHAVKDGPADRSFGLQVAALAGLPKSVVQQARGRLAELEQQQPRRADAVADAGGAGRSRSSSACSAADLAGARCAGCDRPGRTHAQAGARSAVPLKAQRLDRGALTARSPLGSSAANTGIEPSAASMSPSARIRRRARLSGLVSGAR